MKKNSYRKLCRTIPLILGVLLFNAHSLGAEQGGELSLSLAECIRYAALNNYEIKIAQLDYLLAETKLDMAYSIYDTVFSANISYEKDKREAVSIFSPSLKRTNIYSAEVSRLLPSGTELTFSIADTRQWDDSGYVSLNPAHTAEAVVEAHQPMGKNAFGYIDRRAISVTRLSIQNADLDTQAKMESVLAQVEEAYWEWAFAHKSLKIYQEILEKARDLHRANARNYSLGLIERGDFLASRANLFLREKDVQIADNQYQRAEEKVKLLINFKADARIYPGDALGYRKMEFNLEDCLKLAWQKRRDYRKLKREAEIKNIILETKANACWPEIDLVASFAANGIDANFGHALNNIISEGNIDYYVGIEISIPFENRAANSEFSRAKYIKKKVLLNLKKTERSIVAEVGNAFRDYITWDKNFIKLKQATELQREKLQEEKKRFQAGRSSTRTLIDYQQDYLYTQLELARSLLALEKARINLEKTLNIILEKYVGWL